MADSQALPSHKPKSLLNKRVENPVEPLDEHWERPRMSPITDHVVKKGHVEDDADSAAGTPGAKEKRSNILCSVCRRDGELLCCDGCPRVFHTGCVGLDDVPEDDWFCERCKVKREQREKAKQEREQEREKVRQEREQERKRKAEEKALAREAKKAKTPSRATPSGKTRTPGKGTSPARSPKTPKTPKSSAKRPRVAASADSGSDDDEMPLSNFAARLASADASPAAVTPPAKTRTPGGMGRPAAKKTPAKSTPTKGKGKSPARSTSKSPRSPKEKVQKGAKKSFAPNAASVVSPAPAKSPKKENSLCSVCRRDGELLCCDGCPRVFHTGCVGLDDVPEDDWFCERCKVKREQREKAKQEREQERQAKMDAKLSVVKVRDEKRRAKEEELKKKLEEKMAVKAERERKAAEAEAEKMARKAEQERVRAEKEALQKRLMAQREEERRRVAEEKARVQREKEEEKRRREEEREREKERRRQEQLERARYPMEDLEVEGAGELCAPHPSTDAKDVPSAKAEAPDENEAPKPASSREPILAWAGAAAISDLLSVTEFLRHFGAAVNIPGCTVEQLRQAMAEGSHHDLVSEIHIPLLRIAMKSDHRINVNTWPEYLRRYAAGLGKAAPAGVVETLASAEGYGGLSVANRLVLMRLLCDDVVSRDENVREMVDERVERMNEARKVNYAMEIQEKQLKNERLAREKEEKQALVERLVKAGRITVPPAYDTTRPPKLDAEGNVVERDEVAGSVRVDKFLIVPTYFYNHVVPMALAAVAAQEGAGADREWDHWVAAREKMQKNEATMQANREKQNQDAQTENHFKSRILGRDRHFNKYWLMHVDATPVLFVEAAATGEWAEFTRADDITALVEFCSWKGLREVELKANLQARLPELLDSFEPAEGGRAARKANASNQNKLGGSTSSEDDDEETPVIYRIVGKTVTCPDCNYVETYTEFHCRLCHSTFDRALTRDGRRKEANHANSCRGKTKFVIEQPISKAGSILVALIEAIGLAETLEGDRASEVRETFRLAEWRDRLYEPSTTLEDMKAMTLELETALLGLRGDEGEAGAGDEEEKDASGAEDSESESSDEESDSDDETAQSEYPDVLWANAEDRKAFHKAQADSRNEPAFLAALQMFGHHALGFGKHHLSLKRLADEKWADACLTCGKNSGTVLLCCDICPGAFHPKCVGLNAIPEGDWQCAMCVRKQQKATAKAAAAAEPNAAECKSPQGTSAANKAQSPSPKKRRSRRK